MISTNIHGLIDYTVGILLIVIPWTYPSAYPDYALYIPSLVGSAMIIYSILTKYERSLVKIIPMPVHLFLDAVAATVIGACPWLFDFHEQVFLPHVIISALLWLIIVCSSYESFVEQKITESYNKQSS